MWPNFFHQAVFKGADCPRTAWDEDGTTAAPDGIQSARPIRSRRAQIRITQKTEALSYIKQLAAIFHHFVAKSDAKVSSVSIILVSPRCPFTLEVRSSGRNERVPERIARQRPSRCAHTCDSSSFHVDHVHPFFPEKTDGGRHDERVQKLFIKEFRRASSLGPF